MDTLLGIKYTACPFSLREKVASGRMRGIHPDRSEFNINFLQNIVSVVQDSIVPEPDYPDPCSGKSPGTLLVIGLLSDSGMAATIKFNGQIGFIAEKIYDVSTNRILSTKLITTKISVSQKPPEKLLCVSLIFTHLSCKL